MVTVARRRLTIHPGIALILPGVKWYPYALFSPFRCSVVVEVILNDQ